MKTKLSLGWARNRRDSKLVSSAVGWVLKRDMRTLFLESVINDVAFGDRSRNNTKTKHKETTIIVDD